MLLMPFHVFEGSGVTPIEFTLTQGFGFLKILLLYLFSCSIPKADLLSCDRVVGDANANCSSPDEQPQCNCLTVVDRKRSNSSGYKLTRSFI